MNIERNKNKINNIAQIFSRCFFDDPLFKYFFQNEKTRKQESFYTFRFIVSHALKKGYVISSNSMEGAAVWLPSERIKRNLLDQLRFGLISMLIKQKKDAINRQIFVSTHMQTVHKSIINAPHLYLSTIGVDKDHRKKGTASLLIRPMLEKAAENRLPCYLDTHNEKNLSLYTSLGFKVVRESKIPDSNVSHWSLLKK